MEAGKATIAQANSLIPSLQRQLQNYQHLLDVKDSELLQQRNACDDLRAQLAFATNSDHDDALSAAAAALAEVSQQLQRERSLHAATADKLKMKCTSHAALEADVKHLKDLATQSRLAKQRNIHESRQQEATVSVLRCSLDDVSSKLKDKTCDGERLGKELHQLQGQYAAALKSIEELTHDKGKLATENLKLQVQKEK